MTLSWYGLSSFKITTVGNEVTLYTDPFSKQSGLTPPRGAADIVLISRDDEMHNNIDGMTGTPLIIRNPGEFDIKGVHIQGILDPAGDKPTTIYRLEVDGVKIGFLGAYLGRELSEQQLDQLNGVDILIVPVGGKEKVANWEWASHIVQQVEPKLVIPCYFDQKGLSIDLDGPEKFLKELGGEPREEERLTLKAKDLVSEKIEVVKMVPQR